MAANLVDLTVWRRVVPTAAPTVAPSAHCLAAQLADQKVVHWAEKLGQKLADSLGYLKAEKTVRKTAGR